MSAVVASRPVQVTQVLRQEFAGESASAADPQLRPFLQELVEPYGLPLRDDLLDAGRGHSYGEMALAVLAQVASAERPVDLLVLAHAMPDVIPGRSTATFLSSQCPGAPLAFAVCDQGMAAAFTALAVAHAYVSGGNAQRAVLLVLEQAVLHYEPAAPVRTPASHAAVALVLSAVNGADLAPPVIRPEVSPDEAVALVEARLAQMARPAPDPRGGAPAAADAGGPARTTVVVGAELAALLATARPDGPDAAAHSGAPNGHQRWPGSVGPDRPGITYVTAPDGQPLTGVWTALAAARSARTILADYDPTLRYLCLADVTGPVPTVGGSSVDSRSEQ